MKKLIVISSILAVLASASASAKTEGNYVGVDIHRASMKARNNYRNGDHSNNNIDFAAVETGYGVTYKYAINLDNKIFLAPGVFYENIGTKAIDFNDSPDHFTVKIRNRSGLKLDLGYDLSDNSAIYFTNGVARVHYQTASADPAGGTPGEKSRHQMAYFYGFGLSSTVYKDVVASFEYNTQNLTSKSIYNDTAKFDHRVKTQVDVFKINLAYHF